MERGVCRLCLEERMLCDSHLAPAGLYKYCKAPEIGPISFSPHKIEVANEEVTAYLLCEDCEQLLSKEGENWLLPKLATIEKTFPFYDILAKGTPDTIEGGVSAYACSRNPEIAFRKLTNFAIGVFWKASVYSWKKNTSAKLIELGPYREQFRLFLSERKLFPASAVLTIGVFPPDKAVIGFNLPSIRGKHPHHQFLFYIPGMIFILNVGNGIPAEEKQTCFFSNHLHPIILVDLSKELLGMVNRSTKRAIKSPEVKDFMARRRKQLSD